MIPKYYRVYSYFIHKAWAKEKENSMQVNKYYYTMESSSGAKYYKKKL
jgi:hypothetical protein